MLVSFLNFVVLGLLVFLFAAVASVRSGRRTHAWTLGWIFLLLHYALEFWTPQGLPLQQAKILAQFLLLSMGGLAFQLSTLPARVRRLFRIGLSSAAGNAALLALVIFLPTHGWLTGLGVLARTLAAMANLPRPRPGRLQQELLRALVMLSALGWMLWALAAAQPASIPFAILAESYLLAAVSFWTSGMQRNLGLRTVCLGMIAEGLLYISCFRSDELSAYWIEPIYWHLPKLCIAIGMILYVLEKDSARARAIAEEYRVMFENSPHPLWLLDKRSLRILAVNQAALLAHGYRREEFLRLSIAQIVVPEELAEMLQGMASPGPFSRKCSHHIRKDGSLFPLEIKATNIEIHGLERRFVLATDISERETLARQINHLSRHDLLTGLPNRALFLEQLAFAAQEAVESGRPLAVLCLDLIRLQGINDTYGDKVGDACLQRMAQLMTQYAGPRALLARIGGDEFALAIGNLASVAEAERKALELKRLLAEPLVLDGYRFQIPNSMGMAVCPGDGADAETLWRRAESARRSSRHTSGGELVWSSPALTMAAEEQRELESYMRTQMDDGGFHLAYQPIYDFTGKVCALEALLRLNHPTYGAITPAKFIPLAEETGLIVPLGRWTLEEVCSQLQLWKAIGAPLVRVAVNVSGLQVMRLDFAEQLFETLRRSGTPAELIHLEITETAAMQGSQELYERLNAVASQGIHFSIDDFGSSHSSFERLHLLPISILKIDRSFVDQLCMRGGPYSIVRAILSMAHALGLKVVAEGVENVSQLSCLQALHCDLLQGYLLSRPAAPEEIPALIRAGLPALPELARSETARSAHCGKGEANQQGGGRESAPVGQKI